MLRPYLEWVRQRERRLEVFGEVHNRPLFFWQQVPELIPERRCMLVRNGIQTVHSMAMSLSGPATDSERAWAHRELPPQYAGLPPEDRLFAAVCSAWGEMPELAVQLAGSEVVRLEDLTSGAEALAGLYQRLTGRQIEALWSEEIRRTVLNRKVPGDNSPANLYWNVWSERWRALFLELCARAQGSFGYRIPDREEAPAEPDLSPRTTGQRPPPPLGPLSNGWIFWGQAQVPAVLVCGEPRYAALVASLIGESACVLDAGGWQERTRAHGRFVRPEELPKCKPEGIYVAHPSPPMAEVEQLRQTFPEAELVTMLPWDLPDEALEKLQAAGSLRRRGRMGGEPGGTVRNVTEFGPLRVGDVAAEWRITQLTAGPRFPSNCDCVGERRAGGTGRGPRGGAAPLSLPGGRRVPLVPSGAPQAGGVRACLPSDC